MSATDQLSAAIAHHRRGEADEVERLCLEILSTEPEHPRALQLLGLAASRRGDFEGAADLHRRAAAGDPGDAIARVHVGRALTASGRATAAEQSYREAIAIDPGCTAAHAELGLLRERAGDLAGALAAYGEALRLEAGLPRVRHHLAATLGRLGRLDEAIAHAERAARDAPDLAAPRMLLAGLRLRSGDAEQAIEDCERCLRHEPRNRRAIAFKAIALARCGDYAGSRTLLDLDRLVRLRRMLPPDPWREIEEFNAALRDALPASATGLLPAADADVPTAEAASPAAGGEFMNTDAGRPAAGDELLHGAGGAFGALAAGLAEAVHWYLDHRPRDLRHPFLKWRPRTFHVSGEALRRPAGERIERDLREQGWVSGLYCLGSGSGESVAVLSEVGAPPPCYTGDLPFARRRIALGEGDLVLFPSYFFTALQAAEGPEPSLVIAFDAVPE